MKIFTRILKSNKCNNNNRNKSKGCGSMTHKKQENIKKMQNYQKEKLEIAKELGINGANSSEVNVKIASQGEPEHTNKTMTKHRNMQSKQKTAREQNELVIR